MSTIREAVVVEIAFYLFFLLPVGDAMNEATEGLVEGAEFVTFDSFHQRVSALERGIDEASESMRERLSGFFGWSDVFVFPWSEDGWEAFVDGESLGKIMNLSHRNMIQCIGNILRATKLLCDKLKSWGEATSVQQFSEPNRDKILFVGWSRITFLDDTAEIRKQLDSVLLFDEIMIYYKPLVTINFSLFEYQVHNIRKEVFEEVRNEFGRRSGITVIVSDPNERSMRNLLKGENATRWEEMEDLFFSVTDEYERREGTRILPD